MRDRSRVINGSGEVPRRFVLHDDAVVHRAVTVVALCPLRSQANYPKARSSLFNLTGAHQCSSRDDDPMPVKRLTPEKREPSPDF